MQNFKPFPESSTYFGVAEAEIVVRGKINLLLIRNYQNPSRVSTYTGGGLIPAIIDESMGNYSYMYLLEDGTGYIRAVSPKDKQLGDALLDFFPKEFLDKSAPPSGAFKYKDLLQLVKEYDSL